VHGILGRPNANFERSLEHHGSRTFPPPLVTPSSSNSPELATHSCTFMSQAVHWSFNLHFLINI
jgi:hypothetical protein